MSPTPPPKPKRITKAQQADADRRALLTTYFAPGAIIPGYSGLDRVIAFDPVTENVTVIRVTRDGDPVPGERERTHHTHPSAREMRRNIAQRAPAPPGEPPAPPEPTTPAGAAPTPSVSQDIGLLINEVRQWVREHPARLLGHERDQAQRFLAALETLEADVYDDPLPLHIHHYRDYLRDAVAEAPVPPRRPPEAPPEPPELAVPPSPAPPVPTAPAGALPPTPAGVAQGRQFQGGERVRRVDEKGLIWEGTVLRHLAASDLVQVHVDKVTTPSGKEATLNVQHTWPAPAVEHVVSSPPAGILSQPTATPPQPIERPARRAAPTPQGLDLGLGPQELGGLGRLAQRHWQEFRPKMYADLQESGLLLQTLKQAETQALQMISSLMAQGMSYPEAWEIAQPEILLPSEEDAPDLSHTPAQLRQVESRDTITSSLTPPTSSPVAPRPATRRTSPPSGS